LESQLPQPAVLVGTAGDDGDAQEVALNLAASFARTQRRTLLVSSDLRRRNQRNMLDYAFAGGHNQPTSGPTFSEVLFGDATSEGLSAQAPLMDYLWHMPAGDVTSTLSLADLDLTALQAAIDAIRDDFDAVVMICPSVTRYPDAAVLARVTDGLLLAASARHTRASDVRDATRLIDQVGGQVLGGVLTGPRAGSRGQRVRMSMTAAALGRDDWLGGMPAVPLDAPSAPASLRNVLVHRPAHRGEVTKAVRRSPGARG
jgi:Mrp family chromosome partitioning ATPase